MSNVPPKFYELCRLCLSCSGMKLSIFDDEGTQRNYPLKIMTCLSILVSYYSEVSFLSYLFEMIFIISIFTKSIINACPRFEDREIRWSDKNFPACSVGQGH